MKHLIPEDYHEYASFFRDLRYHLCGYALSSIMAWSNREYQPYGMIRGDALIVAAEFATDRQNRHLILPISPDTEYTPEALADLAVELGHRTYWFVPQDYIDRFGAERVSALFDITHHAAYDDYVFNKEDLAFLKGNKYAKKRNLINQFKKSHIDEGRVSVTELTPKDVDACLIFLDEWCAERDGCDGPDDHDLACEKQAVINTLLHFEQMRQRGLVVRIDGQVNAFGIAAGLTGDMATLQYEKAFSSVKGLYQYLDRECARRLFEGYTYINKESDMGLPGIAKAKKSYHPVMMIQCNKLHLR